ncbi:large conductance mechanosensitive channel protein MscL [bacterium]|nr:large conductance mechanosensitive channel protein MscL [bacterium]
MLQEFKDFAVKGNAIDMAVGIIIGGAFGKIVSSLVSDIIMPPIGKLLGQVNFTDLYINLSDKTYSSLAEAQKAGAATLNYGNFLQVLVDFLIIAWVIFMLVRMMNKMKAPAPAPATPPAPPEDVQLLREIRDLLKR